MLKKEYKFLLALFVIAGFFFYQFFLFGKIPFPGDLLVGQYNPWRAYSFLGFAPGGMPNKMQYFDVLRQIYPWRVLAIESFKHFTIPLWNLYNFSGTPFLANDQSAVWYPFNIFFFLFSPSFAWAVLIILQPLLGSIGTYFFSRKIGIGKWGSLLSSIAYGYCLFQSVFLEYNTIGHVIGLLPWALLSIELIISDKKILGRLLFILSIVFSFFAGHIQIWGFSILFVVAYALFRFFQIKKRKMYGIEIAGSVVISLLLSGIQLLPTLELIHYAARIPQNYSFLVKSLLIQPYQLFVLLIPDLFGNPAAGNYLLSDSYPGNAIYIGIVPLFFALYSFFNSKFNKYVLFFTFSVGIILIFLVRTPFTDFFYKWQIPFFSTGSPSNALFLVSFSLAILGGMGFEYFLQTKNKHIFIVIFLTCLFITLSLLFSKIFQIQINMKNVIFSFGVLGASLIPISLSYFFRKQIRLFCILLVVITVLDLFYFFNKFNPFVNSSLIFPSVPIITTLKKNIGNERVWSYGDGAIEPNVLSLYHIQDPQGYDPLYPKSYGEFISSSFNGEVAATFTNQSRSDAVIAPAYLQSDLEKNPNRLKVLNATSVGYILSREVLSENFLKEHNWQQIASQEGWNIYRNLSALPPAYLVYKEENYSNPENFAQKYYSNKFDARSTVLLKYPVALSGTSGEVHLKEYYAGKIIVQTTTNGRSLLALTTTYFPGWNAYIDGEKKPILKTNYTFQGVVVPGGTHTIIFSYQPSSFSTGLTLTIIGIVVGFGWIIVMKKYKQVYE